MVYDSMMYAGSLMLTKILLPEDRIPRQIFQENLTDRRVLTGDGRHNKVK